MSTETLAPEQDRVDDGESGSSSHRGPVARLTGLLRRLARVGNRTAVVTLALLVVLLGVTVTATVVLTRDVNRHAAIASAAQDATEAARSRVPAVLSYDFTTVDAEFPKLADNLTGKFREDYGTLATNVIIPAAHRDSIVTKATVAGAAVVSAEQASVTVLLFLNQETTSAKYQGPRLDGSRVRVLMTEQSGTWLISEITPL